MYSLYRKSVTGTKVSYQFVEEVSLFGCNEGYIPWLLSFQVPTAQGEPFTWHVDIETALAQRSDVKGNALIINVMPSSKDEVLLCELVGAWGYSNDGWTPMMLHLRGLINFESIESIDQKQFECQTTDVDDPIFSMMYLRGSVKGGKLFGKWTTPGRATNAVLLWPDTFEFFFSEANKLITRSEP